MGLVVPSQLRDWIFEIVIGLLRAHAYEDVRLERFVWKTTLPFLKEDNGTDCFVREAAAMAPRGEGVPIFGVKGNRCLVAIVRAAGLDPNDQFAKRLVDLLARADPFAPHMPRNPPVAIRAPGKMLHVTEVHAAQCRMTLAAGRSRSARRATRSTLRRLTSFRFRDSHSDNTGRRANVRALIDDLIAMGGVDQLLSSFSLLALKFKEDTRRISSREANAREMRHGIHPEIELRVDANPDFSSSRRERLARILDDPRQARIDAARTASAAGDGRIRVGVVRKGPVDATPPRLADVLKTKAPWILQGLLALRELGPGPTPREFVAGQSYGSLDRSHSLRTKRSSDASKPSASLHPVFLTISPPAQQAEQRHARVKRAVVARYGRQTDRRLNEWLTVYPLRARLQPPRVLLRAHEKRWLSCNSKGELPFNQRVNMPPISLVAYVVVHEGRHLIVRDHPTRFWKLPATILRATKERRARLIFDGVGFQVRGASL